ADGLWKRVPGARLEALRVARYVAVRRTRLAPAGAAAGRVSVARAPGVPPAGVESQAGDDEEGVAAVRVDRHPPPGAALPVAHQLRRVLGARDQVRAVKGERDGAGAVVAAVVPASVPAAVDVRLGDDLVGGGDDLLDLVGRAARSDRLPVAHGRLLRRPHVG